MPDTLNNVLYFSFIGQMNLFGLHGIACELFLYFMINPTRSGGGGCLRPDVFVWLTVKIKLRQLAILLGYFSSFGMYFRMKKKFCQKILPLGLQSRFLAGFSDFSKITF